MYFLTNVLIALNRTFKQIEEIGLNAEKNWSENYSQRKLNQSCHSLITQITRLKKVETVSTIVTHMYIKILHMNIFQISGYQYVSDAKN